MPRVAVDDNQRMNLRLRPEQKATLMRAAALRTHELDGLCSATRVAGGRGGDRGIRPYHLVRARQPFGAEPARKSTSAECQAAGSHRANAKANAETRMSVPVWCEEPISKKHDRKSFDCGDPAMNDFFERYARQSHESGAAKTFLAIDNADNKSILGFYSLAPGALAYTDTPEAVRLGLARHDAPGFRLARITTGPAQAESRFRWRTPRSRGTALPARCI